MSTIITYITIALTNKSWTLASSTSTSTTPSKHYSRCRVFRTQVVILIFIRGNIIFRYMI